MLKIKKSVKLEKLIKKVLDDNFDNLIKIDPIAYICLYENEKYCSINYQDYLIMQGVELFKLSLKNNIYCYHGDDFTFYFAGDLNNICKKLEKLLK